MTTAKYSILVVLLLITGCVSSFQGIKIRGQSPPIEEAFRKLSLAVTVDGFEIESSDAARFTLESKWREQNKNEVQFARQNTAPGKVKLSIRFERRGSAYDVVLTPQLRIDGTDATPVLDVQHPLVVKWKRILNSVIQKETREED